VAGEHQSENDRASRARPRIMWKSFFLASGLFACVLGIELLVIDSATIMPLDGRGSPRIVTAPDWAPWTLISAGAVTILHFATLPRTLIRE
jgi:hypothetical protein